MKVNRIAAGAGALALSVTTLGAALGSFASPAGASSTHHANFTELQQQLEQQIANRQARLANLTKDVAGAKSLTSAHATLLNTRLSAETTNITALAAKVPTDTTNAQLSADRSAMLRDNRVYAVMTPQVFQTIEADSIAAQVTTLQADEAGLQSEVAALVAQPGYETAEHHYQSFVSRVGTASATSARVATVVLAQVPADFPGDTHVFVSANRQLLAADVAIAYANYDVTVIGLASGGYTGS